VCSSDLLSVRLSVLCSSLAMLLFATWVVAQNPSSKSSRIGVETDKYAFRLWYDRGAKKSRIMYRPAGAQPTDVQIRVDDLKPVDFRSQALINLRVSLEAQALDSEGNASSESTNRVRITYKVVNQDMKPHRIDLRLVVDTLLDASDSQFPFDRHPFVVPGKEGRISTSADFNGPDAVPPYFKAVTPTAKPTEIVFLLRGFGRDHGPRRCVFTSLGYGSDWDIEPRDMSDSSFVLYWEHINVARGAEERLSFDCGIDFPDTLLRSLLTLPIAQR